MRTLILLLVLVLFHIANAAPKKVQTPVVVKNFLHNLEAFSTLSDSQREEAFNLHSQNVNYFTGYTKENTIDCDPDFNSELYYLGLGEVNGAESYCRQLYKYIYKERVLKLSTDILTTEPIYRITDDGKDEIAFYDTKVKKTCSLNGKSSIIVWQNIEVLSENGLINTIRGYDSEPSDWSISASDGSNMNNKLSVPEIQDGTKSHSNPSAISEKNSIRDKRRTEQDYLHYAFRLYSAKDYSGASKAYLELVDAYPKNAEAWYRLALMIRYKKKWSKSQYRDYKKVAIEYMQKAYDLATGKLKSKAENVLFYWEHPNYM